MQIRSQQQISSHIQTSLKKSAQRLTIYSSVDFLEHIQVSKKYIVSIHASKTINIHSQSQTRHDRDKIVYPT